MLETANEELAQAVSTGEPYRALFDATRVTRWDLTTDDLRALGSRWEGLFKDTNCERAAAVTDSDLLFGDLRMTSSAFLGKLTFPRQVFRNVADATRWLASEE